jgi:hypothetical protein
MCMDEGRGHVNEGQLERKGGKVDTEDRFGSSE